MIQGQRKQAREVEALLQLLGDFTPRAPMPPSGGWALDPTGILGLLSLIERRRPKLVVELGSGTSTIWIAYALERFGGRLVSVDHEAHFAARTEAQLATHKLAAVAEIRTAELTMVTINNEEFAWYDTAAFSDLKDVDLLLVDGPPKRTGPLARYPTLTALGDRLSSNATVVLDDTDRPDEQEIVRRWLVEVPGMEQDPVAIGNQLVLAYSRFSPAEQRDEMVK